MIEKREKRKRIFYVPGMISLGLMPLFFLIYFSKADLFYGINGLSIDFESEEFSIENKINNKKDYESIVFDRSIEFNRNSLSKLRLSLETLKKRKDTINGIRLRLGKNMSYEVFVEIVDLLHAENISTWRFYDNDIWIFLLPKLKESEAVKEKIIKYCSCVYNDIVEKEKKEEENRRIIASYKKNWIVFPGYLGIVLINIFALVKFNKNQKYNQK